MVAFSIVDIAELEETILNYILQEDSEEKLLMFYRKLKMLDYDFYEIFPKTKLFEKEALKKEQTYFTNYVQLKSGSYGSVYSCFDANTGKYYAHKFPVGRNKADIDLYRELIISNYVNSLDDRVCIKMYGFNEFNETSALIMDHGLFTLKECLKLCIKFDRYDIGKQLFKNLIEITRLFNNMGFFHSDIKPENVIVMPDLSLRLIDFGLSFFIGHSRKIRTFLQTYEYKPPDDIEEEIYSEYSISEYSFESKCEGKGINQTSDLFSIAVIMYNFYFNKDYKQIIFVDDRIYEYRKTPQQNTELILLQNNFTDLILMDFLKCCLCHNNNIRFNCTQALEHEFFGEKYQKLPVNFVVEGLNQNFDYLGYYEMFSKIIVKKTVNKNVFNRTFSDVDEELNFLYYICSTQHFDEKLVTKYSVDVFYHQQKKNITIPSTSLALNLNSEDRNIIFFKDHVDFYCAFRLRTNTTNQLNVIKFKSNIYSYLRSRIKNNDSDIRLVEIFEEIF